MNSIRISLGALALLTSLSFAEPTKTIHEDEVARGSTTENCTEVVRVACAFMKGCRTGHRVCDPKVINTSECWTQLNKEIVELTSAQCSQWVHINNHSKEPVECYLGSPKRDKDGLAPQSFLLSELRKKMEKVPNK